jgi:hypothetical protein
MVNAYVKGKNIGEGTKITLSIKYSANGTDQKLKIRIPTGDLDDYIQVQNFQAIPVTGTISFMRLKIKNKSTGGKLLIDDVRLVSTSGGTALQLPPSSDEVLPLPSSSNGRKQ